MLVSLAYHSAAALYIMVSRFVSVLIVYPFEIVHIHHNNGKFLRIFSGEILSLFDVCSLISHACQGILVGLDTQLTYLLLLCLNVCFGFQLVSLQAVQVVKLIDSIYLHMANTAVYLPYLVIAVNIKVNDPCFFIAEMFRGLELFYLPRHSAQRSYQQLVDE